MEYGIRFARGWLIADQEFFGSNEPRVILDRLPSYFTAARAGSNFFFCHDVSLAATVREYPDFTVILVGIAYDIRDGRISSAYHELCEDIHTSFSFEKDFSQNTAFLELADNLAGRFAILLIRSNRIFALNDCSGLRSIYYHISKTAIASSYGLIALYSPEPAANHYQELYREHSLLKQPVPRSLWGDQSPYASIRLLVPNHYLQMPEHKVERFFPRSALEPVSLQDAASYLASSLKRIMNRLNQDFNIYLSLTTGMDSRTTLAACKEIKDDITLFSYYYDGNEKEAYLDFHRSLAFCRKISLLYNIRHREMRLTGLKLCPEEKEEMLTNTYLAPHEGELAFFRQVFNDHKSINIRSNMYEIIKSNRWDIFPDWPDEKIARIMTRASMISSASKYYKDAQEYYLNYIRQYKIRDVINLGYNYGDLFYAEFRGAIWLAAVYAEPDSVIESFTPINCRNLIKTALAIPQEIKDKNMLQYEIITQLWPELLSDYKYPNIICHISNLVDYIDFPESIEIDYLKEYNKNVFIKSYNHSDSQRNDIDFKKINYTSILFGFNSGKLCAGDTVELTYKRHIRANTRYRLSFDLLIRHSKYNSAFNIDYEIWLNGERRCRESIAKFQGFNQFIYIGIPKAESELILAIKIINLEQESSIFNNSVLKLSNLAFCEEHELLFDDCVILTSPLLKKAYELIQKMNGAPESAAESILAPARNETVLFQPLPLENIGFVELLEDTLHYTQFNKLWTLKSPFQNLASRQECLPATASPVFLFQLSGHLCAILDESGKYIWHKLDTSWSRLGAWPGAKPVYYADSGLGFTIILSVTPQGKGAGLTLVSMDGKIKSIPPDGLGGDPRSLNIIGDTVYISSVNPAAIFTCSTIALLEWLNSDSSSSPFSLASDSLPCAVHNMLDAGEAPVFARGGRTELFNAQGRQLFLDEARANCGFQINAAFTPSLSGKWHIIGTVQRDETHPRACLYLLDSHFQPRMKKTGDNGSFSAYAGYIMRNRRSGGRQTVFANSAGWPLLVRAYHTIGDFQNSGLAENLKLEYAAENAFFYSRAPIAPSDNTQSLGTTGSAGLSPASLRRGANWPFANTRSADTGRPACKLPYPRIEISYEELTNIAHFSAGPVWYRINWDGVDFDFLVVSKKPSRKLVILGTGDFDKSRNPMPIFSRHSWWEDINANCIWYFDPSALQGEASLCWGYGTNDRWLLKDIANLLEIMASALDAPDMLFFGSSGAGYTSLALATLLRKKALAINPQLDCLAFHPSIVEKFLRSCVGGKGVITARLNILELIKTERYCPDMTIVQNAAASHDMEKHILPFINHCSEMEFITSPVKFSIYHNPEGHNGLPSKKDTIAFIHQALSAWDSVEHQQRQECSSARLIS